jgi:FKBP-type peptidyl-prolyl cis-trans isomerase
MRLLMLLLAFGLTTPALAAPVVEDADALYGLGLSMAQQMGPFDLSAEDLDHVIKGLRDGIAGTPSQPLEGLDPKIRALVASRSGRVLAKAKAEGALFQAKVGKEPGAQTTKTGLVFVPIKPGTGASPTLANKVTVHYRGTFMDGREFDSSYKRGEPTSFPLGGVVPCWKEGVAMMKKGGKAKLVCPSDLAYGDRGAPPDISPGATLVFEVELLEIK